MTDTSLPPSTIPSTGLHGWAERGLIPDPLLRLGIRRLCQKRLHKERAGGLEATAERFLTRIHELRESPVAIHTDAANEQHYELPAEFFTQCLGPRLKYSACYYATGNETLAQAEEAMLRLYGERAELADGQHILELGCGWGSLTLWMAEQYPNARITAVSNSNSQRAFINARCEERGLTNVHVITCDVNHLSLEHEQFDRCVSIEMFEHMRNYGTLLENIAVWLKPKGKLFVHIFCHRTLMYPFTDEENNDWMARHFFTGGLMPAADTLLFFQEHLCIEERWLVNGRHYEQTANHWLAAQDAHRDTLMLVLKNTYGDAASIWWHRWRLFWLACAELFGFNDGNEWPVAHYRFIKKERRS